MGGRAVSFGLAACGLVLLSGLDGRMEPVRASQAEAGRVAEPAADPEGWPAPLASLQSYRARQSPPQAPAAGASETTPGVILWDEVHRPAPPGPGGTGTSAGGGSRLNLNGARR